MHTLFCFLSLSRRGEKNLGRSTDENRWQNSVRNTREKNNRHLLVKPNLVPPSHSSRVQLTAPLRQRLWRARPTVNYAVDGALSVAARLTLHSRCRNLCVFEGKQQFLYPALPHSVRRVPVFYYRNKSFT